MSDSLKKKPDVTLYDGFIRLKLASGRSSHDLSIKQAEALIKKLTESVNILKVKQVMES